MKVSGIMQRSVEFVKPDTKVREVSRVIFGRGINGVPVCKGKKVIGFVTERDILKKFYPSMEEYMNDPVHSSDFEGMEKNVSEILELPVEKIMSKNPITISPETPVMKAQSLMFVNKVGRLPVVDEKDNLVGIVTKADIFKAVVGWQLPFEEEDVFYDWLAQYYDNLIDFKKRLEGEIPDIVKLFKSEKIQSLIDIGSSTGEHSIALAKNGFSVFGLDASYLISQKAEEKTKKLDADAKKRISFLHGDYKKSIRSLPKNLDAAIFMGNAFSHVSYTDKNILREIVSALNPEKSVLVFQVLNYEKLFNLKEIGVRDISLSSSKNEKEQKAFIGFYTRKKGELPTYSRAIFDLSGGRWSFVGIKTTPILDIGEKELIAILKKLGFSKISTYGGFFYGDSMLKESFNPKIHDWLNIVAKR